MQNGRLLEIFFLLLRNRKLSAMQLAKQFEVSTRTIYRDIDALSAAGVPVYTTTGRNGGAALMEGYTIDRSVFSEDERDDILIAMQALTATQSVDTAAIVRKMATLFRKREADWLTVDFARWGIPVQYERDVFERLRQAVLNRSRVSFDYINSKGETGARKIEPLRLLFKSTAWYLCGFCLDKQDLRLFRISRMQNIVVLPESFDRETNVDAYLESARDTYAPMVRIELTVTPKAAHRLCDTFDITAISARCDGSYHASVEVPEDGWLYSFLMTLGADILALTPARVREGLIAHYEEALNKLKGTNDYDS